MRHSAGERRRIVVSEDKMYIAGKENLKSFFDTFSQYLETKENQNQPMSKFLEYVHEKEKDKGDE